MANSITITPLLFLVFTTFYHTGEARSFVVGGSSQGWKIPESSNDTLNHWAESARFRVGDVLVFNYDAKKDSVLQVIKEKYESCNIEKPLKEYKDKGSNNVTLDVSGPHYFISGAHGNCHKGEKLIVVVQSPNHPKPEPASPPPTPPSKPPSPPPSKPPTSPPATPPSRTFTSPAAPAPVPANAAVGLVAGNGILWAFVAIIGLAWA